MMCMAPKARETGNFGRLKKSPQKRPRSGSATTGNFKKELILMAKEELSQEAKQARREYLREWRRSRPEKVREYNQRYWERKAQEQKQASN